MRDMKKILVVSCSKTDGKDSQLFQSLQGLKDDVSLIMNANNKAGLPVAYNRQLKSDNLIKHDIVLFVHDDVFIDDVKCFDKIDQAVKSGIDIVGLAGANQAKIKAPTLWHLMSDRKHWSGSVAHTMPQNQDMVSTTCFGPAPCRCVILDGLFLAVNIQQALDVNWRFNENFQFHHYDISSCLDANAKQMKLSTWPINVVHKSLGLWDYNGTSFQQSEKKFLQLYAG